MPRLQSREVPAIRKVLLSVTPSLGCFWGFIRTHARESLAFANGVLADALPRGHSFGGESRYRGKMSKTFSSQALVRFKMGSGSVIKDDAFFCRLTGDGSANQFFLLEFLGRHDENIPRDAQAPKALIDLGHESFPGPS